MLPDSCRRPVAEVAGGAAAFAAAIYGAHTIQHALGVHTASRILGVRALPNLLGVCAVAAASGLSLVAAEAAGAAAAPFADDVRDAHGRLRPRPLLGGAVSAPAAALLGGACFVALGGRFWALSPSNLATLGAYARTATGSLPATLNYASSAERAAIQRLGRTIGCHSCGARWGTSFIGDHMPPVSEVRRANAALWRRLLRQPVAQRFYPQCKPCSAKQGALLATGPIRRAARWKGPLLSRFLGARRAGFDRALRVPVATLHAPLSTLLRRHSTAGAALTALTVAAEDGARIPADVVSAAERCVDRASDVLSRLDSRGVLRGTVEPWVAASAQALEQAWLCVGAPLGDELAAAARRLRAAACSALSR